MLALGDGIAVALATLLFMVFYPKDIRTELWAFLVLPAWIVLAKLHGLYDRDHRALRHLSVDELPALFAWAMSGTVLTTLALDALSGHRLPLHTVLLAWLLIAVSVFAFRGVSRWIWRAITARERIVVLGEAPLADSVRRKLDLFPDIHGELVGVWPATGVKPTDYKAELADIDRIIVASSYIDESLIANLLALCRRQRIKLTVVPPTRGMFGTAIQLSHVADLPVVEFNTGDVSISTLMLKRAFDVLASAAALIALAPLFVAIAIAIRLDSRGPVVFRQTRAGRDGQQFRMYKFRTMVVDAEDMLADLISFDHLKEPVFKLQNDPRVTRVGRFLRRTSLDELPQLLNILKGEMSIVGPRPEQLDLVERYSEEERFRLAVKPGLTGPMQVYGRGHLTLEERLAVEREYIENLSIGRDLMIIAMTVSPLVSGKGAF
jgi:exopolysaccharide biosynthesis polyprenyl glycosylphosphotransferase